MKGKNIFLGFCFIVLFSQVLNTDVSLDEAYKKTKCYSNKTNQNFDIDVKYKTGKLKIKWGKNDGTGTGTVIIVYNGDPMDNETVTEGYYKFDLSNPKVSEQINIEFIPEDDDLSTVCFDYLKENGKEITFYTTEQEQNSFNVFKEEEMNFYINSSNLNCEILLPSFNRELNYKAQIKVKMLNGEQEYTLTHSGSSTKELSRLQFYYDETMGLVRITLTLNDVQNTFNDSDIYTLKRTNPISLEKETSKKFEIGISEAKDVPMAYYFPLKNIAISEKQIVYTSNMRDSGVYYNYEWNNNEYSINYRENYDTSIKNLKVIDELFYYEFIQSDYKSNLISTILIDGDTSMEYFFKIEIKTYEDFRYIRPFKSKYDITRNFVEPDIIYNKTKLIIYEALNDGSKIYYKMNNIVGNSKFLYNEGNFKGNELREEFSDKNDDCYLDNKSKIELYFTFEKENEESSYTIIPYFNLLNNQYEILSYDEYQDNFIGLYSPDKMLEVYHNPEFDVINTLKLFNSLKDDPPKKDNSLVLFQIPHEIPTDKANSIKLEIKEENNIINTTTLNTDNPLYKFECNFTKSYTFSFTADKEIIIEISRIDKMSKEKIIKIDKIDEYYNYPKEIDNDVMFVYKLDKKYSDYKNIKVDVNLTDINDDVELWKFYGNCDFPVINNSMRYMALENYVGVKTCTFTNDFSQDNKLNKDEEICIAIYQGNDVYTPVKFYYSDKIESKKSTEPSSGLEGWEIALIVIFVVLGVGAIGFVVYWFKFRKKKIENDVAPAELNNLAGDEALVE